MKPRHRESFDDYVGRLSDENRLSSSGSLHKAINAVPASERDVLGLDRDAIFAIRVETGTRDRRHWRGIELHLQPSAFNGKQSLFCPYCLAEEGVRDISWRVRYVVVCVRHGVRLLAQCPTCRKSPTSRGGTAKHCSCGADLSRADAPLASSEALEMQTLINLAVDEVLQPGCEAASIHPAAELFRHPLALTLLDRCHNLTLEASGQPPKCRPRTISARYNQLDHLAPIFRDWPHSFERAWVGAWGAFYRTLEEHRKNTNLQLRLLSLHRLCESQPSLPELPAMSNRIRAERTELRRIALDSPAARRTNAEPASDKLSLEMAMATTALSPNLFLRMFHSGLIPHEGKDGQSYVIDRSVVAQLNALRLQLVGAEEAQHILGIPRLRVHRLFSAGFLKCAWGYRQFRRAQFHVKLFQLMFDRLDELAAERTRRRSRSVVDLVQATPRRRGLHVDVAEFYRAVLTGRVPVYLTEGRARGLARWSVDFSDPQWSLTFGRWNGPNG